MAKIITISNQKGGVGKTTTAVTMAASLQNRGYKVLLVDTDPQANATDTYNADNRNHPTIFDVFEGESTLEEAIQTTPLGDIVPGYLRMSGADKRYTENGREYILREALEPVTKCYDYILIDTPPALGIITVNAMTAADLLVIPTTAERYSMQGISQIWETIASVRKYSNQALQIDGLLLTKHTQRQIMTRKVAQAISNFANSQGTKVYDTAIRVSVSMQESQTRQSSIFEYDAGSTVAQDYDAFVSEFLSEQKEAANG